ncbi:hypothetical protein GCM10011380_00220 [Sphingomonas metalli]|uniref:Phosphoadenosine phosphosulphate reductase domain-containing protein n=1 Tax=Sphingomonas metalli TaxID=1779358 RepID=A0A916SUS4_9SPHN|nr:DNA N-6-adenine-methyltransferase [Sphingomonas metalli]GGB14773.1 hypothetical protein GCM10011380_00220 [Sphingomonas metalli]
MTEASALTALADRVEGASDLGLFDATTDPESCKISPSLSRAKELSAERIDRIIREEQPTHIIATVSGGRDSAAEVELARDMGVKIDLILHCRTGTGIQETTDHVVDYYGSLGPDFVMADAGTAYEEYVMRKGFFGIGRTAHNYSYRVLKATPMRKAISHAVRQGRRGVRVLLLNGARASESDNRQANLPETRRDPASPGNMWVNLIHDWTAGTSPARSPAPEPLSGGLPMCGNMGWSGAMGSWETPGASDEWYTPAYVFEALGETFDVDVAAPVGGAPHVPASKWITSMFGGGLESEWGTENFVWMNPPFGGRNAIVPWLAKFFKHGNGIALTPDRTSASWFWDAWSRADRALFTRKIRFLRPDGTEGVSPSTGTCLWAAGDRATVALERAAIAGLGILAQPLRRAA